MKCEVIQDLLDRYIDNTCSEETRRLVEEHLVECEDCRKLYNQIKNIEYEIQPTIDEIKPFKKFMRDQKNRVFFYTLIISSIALFFVLFGETIEFNIVEYKMVSYVEEHYPDENYMLKQTGRWPNRPIEELDGIIPYYDAWFYNPNNPEERLFIYSDRFFTKFYERFGDFLH